MSTCIVIPLACVVTSSWITMDIPERKPCWRWVRMLGSSRCDMMWRHRTCSSNLEQIQVREMGRWFSPWCLLPSLCMGNTWAFYQSSGITPLLCGIGGMTEIQVSGLPENRDVPLAAVTSFPTQNEATRFQFLSPTDKTCFYRWAGESFGLNGQPDWRVKAVGPCWGELAELPPF